MGLQTNNVTVYLSRIVAFFLLTCGLLALSCFLYEAFFPSLLWLGQPMPVILLTFSFALLGAWRWQQPITALLPLALGLGIFVLPNSTLLSRGLWLGAGVWGTAVFLLHQHRPQTYKGWFLFIPLALLPFYLITMPSHVGQADTFEFQVVANQLGIAHPTGYPLYLLLGKLGITLNPFGSVALRLNLATMSYGLLASCFIFDLAYKQQKHPLLPLLGAIALGLTPTFWSQAIEAEVYTLHALFVSGALWLMARIILTHQPSRLFMWLAFVIGLGLTNHLTTVFLLPPTGILALWLWRTQKLGLTWRLIGQCAITFMAPLSLYAYLPLRWQAVNDEPMGWARFIDWVVAGRFQGALQWRAWLDDPTRYTVVGRLFEAEWGVILLLLAFIGLLWLALRQNRYLAIVLLITWLGYSFYALNYYVPDLNVFLIPAHIVIGICLACLPIHRYQELFFLLIALIIGLALPTTYQQVNQAYDDGLDAWGRAVLERPLTPNSTLLADSEKIAPLYYLQQVEAYRPDLNIMVLPDEAAYRAEMTQHVNAGETVYLARFLPNIPYGMWSEGPLTAVAQQPPTTGVPQFLEPQTIRGVPLQGYDLDDWIPTENGRLQTALTLHWQASTQIDEVLYVYVRWQGERSIIPEGRHPVNGNYPTNAWLAGQWVTDFHVLPHPILTKPETRALQVALAPPFTQPDELVWQTITEVNLPATPTLTLNQPVYQVYEDHVITGIQLPEQARPQTAVPLIINGLWRDSGQAFTMQTSFVPEKLPCIGEPPTLTSLDSNALSLVRTCDRDPTITIVSDSNQSCGWLNRESCEMGQIHITGVALPAGAVNYEDKIALLDINVLSQTLTPNSTLDLTLEWQGLSQINEDYTVFVQLLNEQGTLVAQIDAWPLQGTYPTSQWTVGETITDPYQLMLPADLTTGNYQLIVGWYLLADLRRLPVLSEEGIPLNDKFSVEGLVVP